MCAVHGVERPVQRLQNGHFRRLCHHLTTRATSADVADYRSGEGPAHVTSPLLSIAGEVGCDRYMKGS